MRALCLVLASCTSLHQLPDVTDARLREPGHETGFVIAGGRVAPNTTLRFRDAAGRWSENLGGRELHVDRDGAWVDRFIRPWDASDAVRIADISDPAVIEAKRPTGALLERDGDAWILSAARPVLQRWLLEIELAIARTEPDEYVPVAGRTLDGDEAKLYQLRATDSGRPLGTWSFSSHGEAWRSPLHGIELLDFIDVGRRMRIGWHWNEIASARVENISGPKTLAALALVAGAAVTMGATANAAPYFPMPDQPDDHFTPNLAPPASEHAAPLFAYGERVRTIIRPLVALDAMSTFDRDYMTTGISARVRLLELVEIGGGAREALTGSHRQTIGMFQFGLHLPLDAALHYAIPLGFEIGAGGTVVTDFRLPWGLRYTTGRWLATITPATPQRLHVDGEPHRWSLASGVELGASF